MDTTAIALAWLDDSPEGSRIWTCRVAYDPGHGFRASSLPTLVDKGVIQDVAVVSGDNAIGLLYTKNNQLLFSWPLSETPIPLTTRRIEGVISSTATIAPDGSLIAAALLVQMHGTERSTVELVAYRINDRVHAVPLARVQLAPTNTSQGPPLIRVVADGFEISQMITVGKTLRLWSGTDSLQSLIGNSGELLILRLRNDLTIQEVTRRPLPDDDDIAFAHCFALVDSAMTTIVAGKPRIKVIPLTTPGRPTRISSAVGTGSGFAIPSVQSLALSDTSALVAWVDTDRAFSGVSMVEGASDPTAKGGDIHARVVTRTGTVASDLVPGFPIATHAQCILLGTIQKQAFLVWAGPGETQLRIELLPTNANH